MVGKWDGNIRRKHNEEIIRESIRSEYVYFSFTNNKTTKKTTLLGKGYLG